MKPLSEQTTSEKGRGQLMLALGVGLILRLVYFIGVSGHDDVSYFNYSLEVLQGTFSTERVPDGTFPFRFRVGMIFPTAAMFKLFGPSEQVAAILPLANSMGLIGLCWWGGKRISPGVGFLSAMLMATFPLAVCVSTSLLPSPFAATFTGVGILLWLNTEQRQMDSTLTTATAGFRYFGSGFVLGLGYFYRLEAGLFVLFFLGHAIVYRRSWWPCLLALCGAAAVVVAESLVYFLLHGEVLYRLQVISGGFSDMDVELSSVVQAKKSPLVYLQKIFLKPTDLGLHWAALLPAAIAAVVFRCQHRTVFLLWFWPVALYLFFGSWSLSSYVPTTKDPRYLMTVSAPGFILLASIVDQLRSHSGWRCRLAESSVVGVVCVSLILTNVVYAYRVENVTGCRKAAHYIQEHEVRDDASEALRSGPIWCEHHAALALRCLLPHREIVPVTIHDLSVAHTVVSVQEDEISSVGIVVVDQFLIQKYVEYSGMLVPSYLQRPPATWLQLATMPHPTDGPAYLVVRLIDQLLGGRLHGLKQSLRTDSVSIYAPNQF